MFLGFPGTCATRAAGRTRSAQTAPGSARGLRRADSAAACSCAARAGLATVLQDSGGRGAARNASLVASAPAAGELAASASTAQPATLTQDVVKKVVKELFYLLFVLKVTLPILKVAITKCLTFCRLLTFS